MAESTAHVLIKQPLSQLWTEWTEIHERGKAMKNMCILYSLKHTQDSDHGGMFCVVLMMHSPASFPALPPRFM